MAVISTVSWHERRPPPMDDPVLDRLPPPASSDDGARVRDLVAADAAKIVVLDDDPTGTQTLHGLDVLTEWSVASLAEALVDSRAGFYILTNTRSLPEKAAIAVNRGIAANLEAAAAASGRRFRVVSRADSTLRGHFPAETDALRSALGTRIDGVILIPAFMEGGRYTVDNVHYLAQGGQSVPVAKTEFAHDPVFGFVHSDLTEWVEEKTRGAVPAWSVVSIDIRTLRAAGGADTVCARLLAMEPGATVAVNAATYPDLEVFVHGMLKAEAAGKNYLCRTAASFVRVRLGIAEPRLLGAEQICNRQGTGGLVVVGSYVERTTRQMESALRLPGTHGIEVVVDRLGRHERAEEVSRVAALADDVLSREQTAVVFTSRKLSSAIDGAEAMAAAQTVSAALVEIVRSIRTVPRFLIAKGGITSSDLAVHGLGVRRALVIGQAAPGVPVWRLGRESRSPGMSYIIFPGNVGGPDALRDLVERLENNVP